MIVRCGRGVISSVIVTLFAWGVGVLEKVSLPSCTAGGCSLRRCPPEDSSCLWTIPETRNNFLNVMLESAMRPQRIQALIKGGDRTFSKWLQSKFYFDYTVSITTFDVDL